MSGQLLGQGLALWAVDGGESEQGQVTAQGQQSPVPSSEEPVLHPHLSGTPRGSPVCGDSAQGCEGLEGEAWGPPIPCCQGHQEWGFGDSKGVILCHAPSLLHPPILSPTPPRPPISPWPFPPRPLH